MDDVGSENYSGTNPLVVGSSPTGATGSIGSNYQCYGSNPLTGVNNSVKYTAKYNKCT